MARPWPYGPLLTWAAERLVERGRRIVEPAEIIRARPWSTTLRLTVGSGEVGTDRTVIWAKTASPPFAYEMRLLAVLSALVPEAVPAVVDLDPEQGFGLLDDGGPTVESELTVDAWALSLMRYAHVQRELCEYHEMLLAAGLPDLRPTAAARALADLAGRDDVVVVGGEYGLTGAEADAVRSLVPSMHAVAARLETAEMPATVQHDDLQPSNVLVSGRLVDWGDASLAHPFASLLTALSGNAGRPGSAAEKAAMRDAYLAAFVDRALDPDDLAELREQARLACLLAPAGRILAWLRVPGALEVHPGAITQWWRRVLAMDWRVE